MRRGTTRPEFDELTFEQPSTAYGAVAPELREEPKRGWKVLGQVLAGVLFSAALLSFGAGQIGSGIVDVEQGRRDRRADHVVDETVQLLAALPYDDVAGMNGASLPDNESTGHTDFRAELSVTAVERGLQVQVDLIDARTHELVREFVAWRGRG